MNDAERLAVGRAVHSALGNPERGAIIPHGALKKARGEVAVTFGIKDKTAYDVYRDLRALVQKEIADAEWYRQFKA